MIYTLKNSTIYRGEGESATPVITLSGDATISEANAILSGLQEYASNASGNAASPAPPPPAHASAPDVKSEDTTDSGQAPVSTPPPAPTAVHQKPAVNQCPNFSALAVGATFKMLGNFYTKASATEFYEVGVREAGPSSINPTLDAMITAPGEKGRNISL